MSQFFHLSVLVFLVALFHRPAKIIPNNIFCEDVFLLNFTPINYEYNGSVALHPYDVSRNCSMFCSWLMQECAICSLREEDEHPRLMPDIGLMNLVLMGTEKFWTFAQIEYLYFNSFGEPHGRSARLITNKFRVTNYVFKNR